jgi:16S rRNA (guanine966-N2)-methyltransferase
MKQPRSNQKNLSKAPQNVRIIAGQWRGRLLPVAQADGLRPTANRVRETLFNWLQFDIHGRSCLDLFSGSGALGFEAASRGASKVTLVERESSIANVLRQQVTALSATQVEVIQADALSFIKTCDQQYDLIFLDPPFQHFTISEVLDAVLAAGIINSDGMIYLEAERNALPKSLAKPWCWWRQAKAGQVEYGLIQQQEQAP